MARIFSDDDDNWLNAAAAPQMGPKRPNRKLIGQEVPTDMGSTPFGTDIQGYDPSMQRRMGEVNTQLGNILSESDSRGVEQSRENMDIATIPLRYATLGTVRNNVDWGVDGMLQANNAKYNTWNANDATQTAAMVRDQDRIDSYIRGSNDLARSDENNMYSREVDQYNRETEQEQTAYDRSKKDAFGLVNGKLTYKTAAGDLVYADGTDAAADIEDGAKVTPIASPTGSAQNYEFGNAMVDGKQVQSRTNKSTGAAEYFVNGQWTDITALGDSSVSSFTKPNASDPVYKDGATAVVQLTTAARTASSAQAVATDIEDIAKTINDGMGPLGTGGWNDIMTGVGNLTGGSLYAPERQKLDHYISKQLPEMIAQLKGMGSMSDNDLRALETQLASGDLQPSVIAEIAQRTRHISEYNVNKYNAWLETGFTPADFSEWSVGYDSDNYVPFSSGEQSTPSSTPSNIARPETQEEFDAIPSGSNYVDPDDGLTYRKP